MKTNDNPKSSLRIRSIIASVEKPAAQTEGNGPDLFSGTDTLSYVMTSPDKRIQIYCIPRDGETTHATGSLEKPAYFILGDYCEDEFPTLEKPTGSSTLIHCDPRGMYPLDVSTSIVGLPPLFLYDHKDRLILTSDLHLLLRMPNIIFEFDPEGLHDFGSIGYPVDGRTLFRNIRFVPGGSRLTVRSNGQIDISPQWTLIKSHNAKDWVSYLEMQAECFTRAIEQTNFSESFLSLTAGLDTRAIFAALVRAGSNIPACTMSGKSPSLDAIAARALCRHYGFKHEMIILGDEFIRDLPSHVCEASRLSGGLASFTQAHEVYFYKQAHHLGSRRLSGNLGNQVGRRGVEKIALRQVNLSLLNPELTIERKTSDPPAWLEHAAGDSGAPDFGFLLQKEIAYSSVANYSIGNNFAAQQVPYGRRELLENLAMVPENTNDGDAVSLRKMRLRDLQHRFFGHRQSESFQLKVINDVGGYLTNYPINWGWRAKGGVSLSGLALGILTASDALVSSKGLYSKPVIGNLLNHCGIKGLHEYTEPQMWIKIHLKSFILDTLNAHEVRQSGIFNIDTLNDLLADFHKDNSAIYKDIIFALDLALAGQQFKASL